MKLVKKISKCFLLVLTCCILLSHAQQARQKGFVINGHIDGIENGTKIYLHDVDAQVKIDSAISVNGNFTLKGQVERPTTCWIECKDQYAIIQVENVTMEFKSPFRNMRLYGRAKGGKEQDLQNQLTALQHSYEVVFFGAYDSLNQKLYSDKEHRNRLAKMINNYQDSAQNVFIEFGKRHPNSFLGLDILYRNRQQLGKDTIEALFAEMDEELRSTPRGQALVTFVYGELAQTGKSFIDFEAVTANGAPFRLSSLRGNYIMLSFWDAACAPCRKENKMISRHYKRLKDKLAIVSFSIDKNKGSWLRASKEDKILWTNVSDLEGTNGKIKTQYDVQAIPTSYLINREGIILEKFIGLNEDFLLRLEKLITDL